MWRDTFLLFACRKPWNILEESCALLGCYAACSGKSLSWPLKMGPIGRPETSVRIYHYTLRNNPEERRSHLHRSGSLKSLMKYIVRTAPSTQDRHSLYVNMDSPSLVENWRALTVWVPTRWSMKHFAVRIKCVGVWKFPSKVLYKLSVIVELASERFCLKRTRHSPLFVVCNFPCEKKLRVIYTNR
jgi:hypothetical protein